MLPRIDANNGRRGTRREFLNSRNGAEAVVVPLPRLRLLKQVGGAVEDTVLPAPLAPLEKVGAPPQRRLLISRAESGDPDHRAGTDHLQAARRGRGLLRPLGDRGQAMPSQPARSRSPPPLRHGRDELLQDDSPQEDVAALLQQRARERVKEQRRQRRRLAREEEERRQQDEWDRAERAQRSAGQIEAHRRELARQAADRARRSREDREDRAQEREELQSARKERMRRYQTPAQIRELRRVENNPRSVSRDSHAEDDIELKDANMPRRAARAPSPELQEVRERRRGSRGRARNGHPRKHHAPETDEMEDHAQKIEESPVATTREVARQQQETHSAVCETGTLEIQPPSILDESSADAIPESSVQTKLEEVASQHETHTDYKPDVSEIGLTCPTTEAESSPPPVVEEVANQSETNTDCKPDVTEIGATCPTIVAESPVQAIVEEAPSLAVATNDSDIQRQLREALDKALADGELDRALREFASADA